MLNNKISVDLKQLLIRAGWAPISVVVLYVGITSFIGSKLILDLAIHFLGGAAIAYFFWHTLIIWKRSFGNPTRLMRYVIVFSLTCTVAVFWEFAEYFTGVLVGVYAQLSLKETIGDLFMGCMGAFVLLIIRSAMERFKNGNGK